MAERTNGFDYSKLPPEVAAQLQESSRAIRGIMFRSAEAILRQGNILLGLEDWLTGAQYREFLESQGIEQRRAEVLVAVARLFGDDSVALAQHPLVHYCQFEGADVCDPECRWPDEVLDAVLRGEIESDDLAAIEEEWQKSALRALWRATCTGAPDPTSSGTWLQERITEHSKGDRQDEQHQARKIRAWAEVILRATEPWCEPAPTAAWCE